VGATNIGEFTAQTDDGGGEELDVGAAKARTDARAAALARILAGPPPGIANVVSFTANAADIAQAVEAVSIVEPSSVTARGESGHLFSIFEEDGRVRGSVSTRCAANFAKAEFPVTAAESCGRFGYPAEHVQAFRYLGDENLTFSACTMRGFNGPAPYDACRDVPPENFVSYTSPRGASSEHAHDLYPELFGEPLAKLVEPWVPHNTAVLRVAIEVALPFLGGVRADPSLRVIQLLKGRNHGKLFAESEGVRVCFECADLAGKEVVVHANCARRLVDFLQRSGPTVEVASSPAFSFARSNGRVFGWAHPDELALGVYADVPCTDILALSVPCDDVVRCVAQAKGELASGRGTIRVAFSTAEGLRVLGSGYRSDKIPVAVVQTAAPPTDQVHRVGVDAFARLFRGASAENLELRIASSAGAREQVVLRTIDLFDVGGHACRVTRSCSTANRETALR
jgi:hypothetical protein